MMLDLSDSYCSQVRTLSGLPSFSSHRLQYRINYKLEQKGEKGQSGQSFNLKISVKTYSFCLDPEKKLYNKIVKVALPRKQGISGDAGQGKVKVTQAGRQAGTGGQVQNTVKITEGRGRRAAGEGGVRIEVL